MAKSTITNITFAFLLLAPSLFGFTSASPTSSTTSTAKSDSSSGLSRGVVAGIVLGVLIFLIAILVGVLLYLRRLKKQRKAAGIWGKEENTEAGSHGSFDPIRTQGKEETAYQGAGENVPKGSPPLETSGLIHVQEVTARG